MTNTTLTLNNIIASDEVLLFDTSDGILVGHNDPTTTMDPLAILYPQYNKWNFNAIDSSNYSYSMHSNIYPISAFILQSYQYKKSPKNRLNNVDDFMEIYGPSSPLLKCCQYFDYGYFMTGLTTDSISANQLVFNSDANATSYMQRTKLPINTYVYPSSAIIILDNNPTADTTSGQNAFVPLYNLSAIQFNFFEELPLAFKYYDYEPLLTTSSYYYLYADSINAKNQYSYDYSTRSIVTSTTDTTHVSATLNNARTYYNIGSTGDLLYTIYRNNLYYSTSAAVDLAGTGITFGMQPTSSFASTGTIVDIPLSNSTLLTSSIINKYDNVEVINSINRIKNLTGHKSNLFSINITNANINSAPLSADEITNIKNELSNIIENIVKNVIPANTQLFKIYWNGQ